MRLASIKPWHQRFAGALFLILARTTCHGQGTASDSPNAIFGCSIAQVRLSVSHVSLAFLKAIDTSTLAMTGLIAMSSIAVGVTSLKFARGHRVLNTGATTAARRSGTFMRALRATAITGFIMCVFDVSKMTLYPNGQIWASHTITILFAALLVSIVSLYVLKNEERIRLEIASTEARYKLLFERTLTGAYRTALDGRVLDCNVSFCQMFGYSTRKEVTGGSVNVGYFSTSDRVLFIERLQAEKSLTNFEQRLKRKNGSPVWVLNSATLLTREDGTGPVIKGTMTDISELRKAEQEHRRLAAIVRCSDDAIISCTIGGEIETWNAGATRIFGFSAEEAVGKRLDILAP